MKKVTLILTAIALVLGMAQCKKEKVEQPAPTEEVLGDPVHITVNVSDNGKHIVVPHAGIYTFTENDKLYVGCGQYYVGTLTYDEKIGAFDGTINVHGSVVGNDYLHFYFVGGRAPRTGTSSSLSPNNTQSFYVDISDQTGNLPVLSYGRSNEIYTGQGSYNCTLLNKCALVEFALTNGTSGDVFVDRMKTQATVDFANPGITAMETRGSIKLHSKSDSRKWAILLPQGDTVSAVRATFSEPVTVNVPAITENAFIHGTSAINVANQQIEGIIPGTFSITSTTKVYFSKGNLQYIGSAGNGNSTNQGAYWKFAENQWQYIGSNQIGTEKTIDRDLFGWGTVGARGSGVSSMPFIWPWETSTYSNYYNGSYPILDRNNDWGRNAIRNGGDAEYSGWRTLVDGEWEYLINTHPHGPHIVHNQCGLIILPDGMTTATGFVYNGSTPAIVSDTDWAAMEAAGALFLPMAGYRVGSNANSVNLDYSYYWSSRRQYNSNTIFKAFAFGIKSSGFMGISPEDLCNGCSVRLVKDVK